ncbi:GyrI-like domain-containing protein [Paenibacillus mendelii]|uniref:GyrI-like domain-containing protein n=1 Tax=Paenibacillus mendelii TaxID=206163 RepID=A0ABV6J4Q7_9BACL|nr:GyrI-like domain-containing protein [Paenibacillus mendelii]MCQ6562011.1 GyrI-like domain-containing protein [Paenibacillus mendelii]
MKIRYENVEAMKLCGLAARTTNAAEAGPGGLIPELWGAFYEKGVTAALSSSADPSVVYGLYAEYESDASGEYTVLLGHRLLENAESAELKEMGLKVIELPAARYAVFTTERGPITQVVPEAWGRIWAYFAEGNGTRTFTGDFERYDERVTDPADAVVEIYIAISGEDSANG